MEKNWTVYKHTFPDGKIYIGITGMNPERRWNNGYGYLDKENGKYHQPLMARAIIQYGWLNVLHEIIESGLNKNEASQMERNLITKYKSNNPEFGYNMADGELTGQSEALKKYVRSMSKSTKCNQTGVIYPSMKEASRQTGICSSSVWNSCKYGNIYNGLSFSLVCDENLEENFK